MAKELTEKLDAFRIEVSGKPNGKKVEFRVQCSREKAIMYRTYKEVVEAIQERITDVPIQADDRKMQIWSKHQGAPWKP